MLSYINRNQNIQPRPVGPPGSRQPRGAQGPKAMTEVAIDNGSVARSVSAVDLNLNEAQIVFKPAAPQPKKKHQSPQEALDEFWGNFNSKTPGKASAVLPKDIRAQKVGEKVPNGATRGQNASASYEEAAKICKGKVDKIIRECKRVNMKYRDSHFDIEFDLKEWGSKQDTLVMLQDTSDVECGYEPQGVKRVTDIFDQPQFYKDLATASDIRQGNDGDCWFLAALCTLANKPGLIEKICVARDEAIGVYGFVFYRDGEWISEIIDDKLFLIKPDWDESWYERTLIETHQRINSEEDYRKIYQNGSSALYFAQCADQNETWLPLLEKAFAKAHGDYQAIEGGFTGEAIEDLTGGVTTELFSSDILDKEYFWKEEILKVNQQFLFGCYSGLFRGRGERKGIVEGHAYSIMKAVEIDGQRLCLLKNPWGQYEWSGPWSDGSKEWTPEWMQKLNHRFGDDGAFWMAYEDLLKKFQVFDRTRLFDDEWKVTQQWTQLSIPWSTDYHTTKFSFTVEKSLPVVLVLSKLNSRYFRGLEGEYSYKLAFRVHKVGDEEYVVRSHGNYWMDRSVTAELELEKGEYHVLVKIEAVKLENGVPVETVVRNNAKDRRNKLVRIGLAYDLAHAKGEPKETDEEKTLKKNYEAEQKSKHRKELRDKLMKEKKKRKHNENKELRKERAAAEKRKLKEKKRTARKAEREKAKMAKAAEEAKKTGSEITSPVAIEKPEVTASPKPDEAPVEISAVTSDTKSSDSTSAEKAEDKSHVAEVPKSIDAEAEKPGEPAKAASTVVLKNLVTPKIVVNGSSPPSEAGASEAEDSDDDEDFSDIESVVSDISSGEIDDAIEEERLAAENAPAPPADDEEEDEFQQNPWNAVATVGLRVYAKGGQISVKVVRPLPDYALTSSKKSKDEKAQNKLDVDDSAVDATKAVDGPATAEKQDVEKGKETDAGSSEGSGVLV